VVDLDDAEAAKFLATFDPLSTMAEVDTEKLDAILRDVDTGCEELQEMLAALAEDAGIIPPNFDPSTEANQSNLDEKEPITCPECGHEFQLEN
jgi:hypothetical protein